MSFVTQMAAPVVYRVHFRLGLKFRFLYEKYLNISNCTLCPPHTVILPKKFILTRKQNLMILVGDPPLPGTREARVP
jgi:hypothetical protein